MATMIRHCVPLLCTLSGFYAQAQLLVNEFSQGLSGNKEYLEFVVHGQRTCTDTCADLRGWIFDDHNGWYGQGAASPGYYRLQPDPVWACVPYGSLILVYNPADLHPGLPPDDPGDANGDGIYVLPISHPWIGYKNDTVYGNTGFTASTDWSGIILNNNSDAVQTIDPQNLLQAHHAVSYGGALVAPVSLPSGGVQTAYFCTGSQYGFGAGWDKGDAALVATPGAANTPLNGSWLGTMRTLQGMLSTVVWVYDTLCEENLPYHWNNLTVGSGGDTAAIYSTASLINGCDSTVILSLHIRPRAMALELDTFACGPLWFEGVRYDHDTVLLDTLAGVSGCDSVYRRVRLHIGHEDTVTHMLYLSGCDTVVFDGKIYYESTVLEQHLSSSTGCDSLHRLVHIEVDPFRLGLEVSPDTPVYAGELITLQAVSASACMIEGWSPEDLFPEQESSRQQIRPVAQQVTISVRAMSQNGCRDTAWIHLPVLRGDQVVFIPNAFSPNGDGINEVFRPVFYRKRAPYTERLQVHDRWGKAVYQSAGSLVYWDGRYPDGRPADAGVYFYYIRVRFSEGTEKQFSGELTLIR